MQGKQPAVQQEFGQDANQFDPETMSNMMMQFAQMQGMVGGSPNSWEMSMSDNSSYHHQYSPAGYPQNQYYFHPQVPLMQQTSGFNMNQEMPGMTEGFNVGLGQASLDEDNWSTRPRARGHISKMDLMYIGEQDQLQKQQPKVQGNFDINILKSVEGLLDDDVDTDKYDSGFKDSNFMSVPKSKVRSMENSGFGGGKYNSGWSDTTASKMNKTRKSGNESMPKQENQFTKSFGDSKFNDVKNTAELSTIFENKEGLFFSWHSSGQTDRRTGENAVADAYCEGFKLIGEPSSNPQRNLASMGQKQEEKESDHMFYSDFYNQSRSKEGQSNKPPSKTSKKDEYTSDKHSKHQ